MNEIEVTLPFSGGVVTLQDPSMADVVKEIWHEDVYRYRGLPKEHRGVVLDMGANSGLFTLYALRFGATRVIALEPDPWQAEYFKRNVLSVDTEDALGLVTLDERAVWYGREDGGIVWMNRDRDPKYPNVNSSVLHYDPSSEPFLPTDDGIFWAPATTIETLFNQYNLDEVAFLKVDIEDAEWNVFRNIEEDTLKKINHIAIETHPGANVEQYGTLVSRLTMTHRVETLGDYRKGGYVYCWRYGK